MQQPPAQTTQQPLTPQTGRAPKRKGNANPAMKYAMTVVVLENGNVVWSFEGEGLRKDNGDLMMVTANVSVPSGTGTRHFLATTLPLEHVGPDHRVDLHLQSWSVADELWSDHAESVWLRRGECTPESEADTYKKNAGVPRDKYASWPAAQPLTMDFRIYSTKTSDFKNKDFRLRLAVVSPAAGTKSWHSPKFTLATRSRATPSDAAAASTAASASLPLPPPPPAAAAIPSDILSSDIVAALNSLSLEAPFAQSMCTLFVAIPAQYRQPLFEDLQASILPVVQSWHAQVQHMLAQGPQELELFTTDVSALFAEQSGSQPPSGLGVSGLGASGLGASGLGASGLGASGLGASVSTASTMEVDVVDVVDMDVSQLIDTTRYRSLDAAPEAAAPARPAAAHYRNLAAPPPPAKSSAVALVSKALARRHPPRSPELV